MITHTGARSTTGSRPRSNELLELCTGYPTQRLTAGRHDVQRHAAAFTSAANLIDPETDAVAMVNAPDDQRAAWSDAQQHAHRLNEHLDVLAAATTLAGVRVQTPTPAP